MRSRSCRVRGDVEAAWGWKRGRADPGPAVVDAALRIRSQLYSGSSVERWFVRLLCWKRSDDRRPQPLPSTSWTRRSHVRFRRRRQTPRDPTPRRRSLLSHQDRYLQRTSAGFPPTLSGLCTVRDLVQNSFKRWHLFHHPSFTICTVFV